MDIPALATQAINDKRSQLEQDATIATMKRTLQQDVGVLQAVASATQPPAQATAASGVGQLLDIKV